MIARNVDKLIRFHIIDHKAQGAFLSGSLVRPSTLSKLHGIRLMHEWGALRSGGAGNRFISTNTSEKITEDTSSTEGFNDPKSQILQQALGMAKESGFPSLAHGMFPNGAMDLAEFFLDETLRHMKEQVEKAEVGCDSGRGGQALGALDVVEVAVMARLTYMAQHTARTTTTTTFSLAGPPKGSWAEAMALGLLPANIPTTAKKVAIAADEICFLAGDRSSEPGLWYGRRAAVASLCVTSEFFMLTDSSPDLSDTRAFVKRRVNELKLIANSSEHAKEISLGISTIATALGSAFISLLPLPLSGASSPLSSLTALASSIQNALAQLTGRSPSSKQESSGVESETEVFAGAPEHDPWSKHSPDKRSGAKGSPKDSSSYPGGPLEAMQGLRRL